MIHPPLATLAGDPARREGSALALCREAFDRIDAGNGDVGAFSDLRRERALEDAREADSRLRRGAPRSALDGIPFAVKDLIDVRGVRCGGGLAHRIDAVPSADAEVVGRLRRAGAVIVGVTETDPGAFSTDTPKVVNPRAPARTAGGSSGGSAAAVAAGMCVGALGTDTGGSIRIPAACCGIAGHKPTYGTFSRNGVMPLSESFDHVGAMAGTVADLRLIHRALVPDAPVADRRRPRVIGVDRAYHADACGDTRGAMRDLEERLSANGIVIRPVSLPLPDDIMGAHMDVALYEAARYHVATFPDHWKDYPSIASGSIELGMEISDAAYAGARRANAATTARVEGLFASVDAVIVPTLPMAPPMRGTPDIVLGGIERPFLDAMIRYTALFNQTGHPVVAMPGGAFTGGLSMGIQVVGARGADHRLLDLARDVEAMLSGGLPRARPTPEIRGGQVIL